MNLIGSGIHKTLRLHFRKCNRDEVYTLMYMRGALGIPHFMFV